MAVSIISIPVPDIFTIALNQKRMVFQAGLLVIVEALKETVINNETCAGGSLVP
jgi:hypothetical protein